MVPSHTLHSQVVDPVKLLDATGSLAQSQRSLSSEDLEDILDRGEIYIQSLLRLGMELNLIEQSDSGYDASSDIALQVRQANQESEKRELLAIQLQSYRPFIKFLKSLLDEVEPLIAARQVGVFYQLSPDEEIIRDQFLKLGEYAEIIGSSESNITFYFDRDILSQNYFQGLSNKLENGLVARLFLENRLDEDIITYIDERCFNQLVVALRNFGSDPNDAISATGRAIETFQRNLGSDFGTGNVDFSGPNGIRELAQAFGSDGLTKDRHQLAGEYLGEMRNNSGGHGIDADTNKHWSLTEEVAFGYILTAIHYIRSTYRWVVDEQLVV